MVYKILHHYHVVVLMCMDLRPTTNQLIEKPRGTLVLLWNLSALEFIIHPNPTQSKPIFGNKPSHLTKPIKLFGYQPSTNLHNASQDIRNSPSPPPIAPSHPSLVGTIKTPFLLIPVDKGLITIRDRTPKYNVSKAQGKH